MTEPNEPFDLLLRGGTVIDGTRAPRFDADVGMAHGRIAAIGDLAGRSARQTIDATGKIVAPGFIDSHTHDDQALLSQPDMSFKVSQGVTTVVAGNCGISIAPLEPDSPLPSPLDLLDAGARSRFATFADYFGERGGLYVTHMRDEANKVMDALDETFRIGRELDVPVVVSHHKVQNVPNFGRSQVTLPHIRAAMQCQCVALDCYPYTAGSTMIRTDRGMLEGRVLIASSQPHPECAGRDLADIAREWNVDKDEAARRLQPGSAIYFLMDEGDVQRILAFDETMIGSDGIPVGTKPHPRLWGTFPRVLGHYSRDVGLFPLETAVWKMTGLTARNFGLAGRGTLAVGQAADVVVFDAAAIRDTATYEAPTSPAEGIDAVIVNGVVAWRDGRHSGARSGRVLRRDPGSPRRSAPRSPSGDVASSPASEKAQS